MSEPLLRVRGLVKHFRLKPRILFEAAPVLKAVDGVDFDVTKGETLGLVGESGCGKTTTARLILRLIEPTAGEVMLDDVDILKSDPSELLRERRQMQLVFQDPVSSLNPRMSVGRSISEPLRFHGIGSKQERYIRAQEFLEIVGLSGDHFDRLPHEFSGGPGPAGRYRPGSHPAAQTAHPRRAGLGARRLNSGANPQLSA